MRDDSPPDRVPLANPGYAAAQLARVLATAEANPDAATRERAQSKVTKWINVIKGMLSGTLSVGSRQPDADMPVWATPEVVTGGFATGAWMAGGPWQPHEVALAQKLGMSDDDAATAAAAEDRQALNTHFLTEAGLADLIGRVQSGHYEIRVPEEGALLAVAWLMVHGHAAEACELGEAIVQHFSTLRFYPVPVDSADTFGARVFLESVGTVLKRLKTKEPNPRIVAEREAIEVWAPLYRRMVALFVETVTGEIPTIQPDASGSWVSAESRRFHVTGGWPCQQYPEGWDERARALVAEVDKAHAQPLVCLRPHRLSDSFARLHALLKRCAADHRSLTGRDVGTIRLILARHITKRGVPGSDKSAEAQARQLRQIAAPTHHDISKIVQQRLSAHAGNAGLEEVATTLQPVQEGEAGELKVPAGTEVPPPIRTMVERCLCDTAEVLVQRGIIPSGDVLAQVIPQHTASLRAQAFDDPALRHLYASIYRAFRRRRSLLLLNFATQVRLEELPWIALLERHRGRQAEARELSRQTLKDVAALALRAFPQVIVPNKLLQEYRALAKGAEMDLPFVEELAADIFMDDFSPKFTQAAKIAAEMLECSLYARYYGVDYAAVRSLPAKGPGPSLGELCISRSRTGPDGAAGRSVPRNGMVIEQAQIITTHNLALLFGPLGLEHELRKSLGDMARDCYRWICRRLQTRSDQAHAKLIMVKQAAYAWRQMIFYLSLLPQVEAGLFIRWAADHLEAQPGPFQKRFAPALNGLVQAHDGTPLVEEANARRFLGWTTSKHWLLEETPRG